MVEDSDKISLINGTNDERVVSEDDQVAGEVLWEYLRPPQRHISDIDRRSFAIVFGCHDYGVPLHAAHIVNVARLRNIVVSGKNGLLTNSYKINEAKTFRQIMLKNIEKKSECKIFEESRSKHSLENVRFSRLLLQEKNYHDYSKGVAVTKPYSVRRIGALLGKQWGSVDWSIQSEDIEFSKYISRFFHYKELTLHFLVGEIWRINEYNGSSCLEQSIPDHVWTAYYHLLHSYYNIDDKKLKNSFEVISIQGLRISDRSKSRIEMLAEESITKLISLAGAH